VQPSHQKLDRYSRLTQVDLMVFLKVIKELTGLRLIRLQVETPLANDHWKVLRAKKQMWRT